MNLDQLFVILVIDFRYSYILQNFLNPYYILVVFYLQVDTNSK